MLRIRARISPEVLDRGIQVLAGVGVQQIEVMDDDLEYLIAAAASSGWGPEPSRRLAEEIESHIVVPLSSRLRAALGTDEAEQLARVVAWERCLLLAVQPPEDGVSWGYLANFVRWRLQDAVRAEVLRRRRHPPTDPLPDGETVRLIGLGHYLERVALELVVAGMQPSMARRVIGVAADGPPFYRSAIVMRLRRIGATGEQAEALSWLLRGGAGRPSALARLANGERPEEVFADPAVRRWVWAAAGRDPRFFGRGIRLGHRRTTESLSDRAA
jgi:hypothetical protein